jgi:hypothetical protein
VSARRLGPVALAAALGLGACNGGASTPAPTPSPTPAPVATTVSHNPENCFTQTVPGTAGMSLRSMIVPDTLRLDLTRPSGFPNGRDLDDPVVDILLAMLFLDFTVSGQSTSTFANLPLNPPGNDRPFSTTFPFLAPPQGTPPRAATTGTTFDFRTDPDSAFIRVDRMGQPAVATALIGSPLKTPYNDSNPPDDVAGVYRADETAQLRSLFNQIGDNLIDIGLRLCSRPT